MQPLYFCFSFAILSFPFLICIDLFQEAIIDDEFKESETNEINATQNEILLAWSDCPLKCVHTISLLLFEKL
jgi:hypothetical protein